MDEATISNCIEILSQIGRPDVTTVAPDPNVRLVDIRPASIVSIISSIKNEYDLDVISLGQIDFHLNTRTAIINLH